MELNGALLNRDLQGSLLSVSGLVRRLGQIPLGERSELRRISRRSGAVRDAVFRALAPSKEPLRAREIHTAAQNLAGTPLSWNSIKDFLHKHARRPASPIECVSHGRYRHR